MSKYTPGPWFVDRHGAPTVYAESLNGGGMLQEVAACGSTEVWTHQEANARLIAAAPELLEALQSIVRSLSDQDDEGLIEHAEPMIAARAAIAKALGTA